MMVRNVIIVAVLFAAQVSAKLPDFIKTCSLSEPDFIECVQKNARLALPNILKGSPELQIPVIYNFVPPPLDFVPSENIHIHSENGATENSKYDVFDFGYDKEKKIIKFVVRTGHSEWTIDFLANGTILDKPILEKGKAKMFLDNSDVHYVAQLGTKEVDGVKYFFVEKQLGAETTVEKFEFKTLEQASVEGHSFSDEQKKVWEETLPKLQDVMAKTVEQLGGPLITHVLNMFFGLAPENEVFLP